MNRVLALINRADDIDRVLKKAVWFSKRYDLVLEVLYVHEESLFDLPDFFKPEFIKDEKFDEEYVKDEIKRSLKSIPYEKDVAVFVRVNDTISQTLDLTDEENLVIHGFVKDLSSKLAKKLNIPLLIIKSDTQEYSKILMPVDLSEDSKECVNGAKDFFEGAKIRIVYDYRYPYEMMIPDVNFMDIPVYDPIFDKELNEELKKSEYERYYKFLEETRVDGDFIEGGMSIDEDLIEYASKRDFDLLYICNIADSEFEDRSLAVSLIENIKFDTFISNKIKG